MTSDDQIQDYVEYLVQCQNVRDLSDLLPEQRSKLSLLILINNNLYVKMLKLMNRLLKEEVKRNDRLNSLSNNYGR
jgi:hypothetical protein